MTACGASQVSTRHALNINGKKRIVTCFENNSQCSYWDEGRFRSIQKGASEFDTERT